MERKPVKRDKIPLIFVEMNLPSFAEYLEMVKDGLDTQGAKNMLRTMENQLKKLGKNFSKKLGESAENQLRKRYDDFIKRAKEIIRGNIVRADFGKNNMQLSQAMLDIIRNYRTSGRVEPNPKFNYRTASKEEKEKFDLLFNDMLLNTVNALNSGNFDEIFTLSSDIPGVIFEGGNTHNFGNVIAAVRVEIFKKVLEDSKKKQDEEVDKIDRDIPKEELKALISDIVDNFEAEDDLIVERMTPYERLEFYRQENPETNVNEVIESVEKFNWLRMGLLLPFEANINQEMLMEIVNKFPGDFNDEPMEILRPNYNEPVADPVIDPVVDNDAGNPFWTNSKIAVVGGLMALLAAAGIYYLSRDDVSKEQLDAVISDDEFEKKKNEGFIPKQASKREFVEAFNLTIPEQLENFDISRMFLDTYMPENLLNDYDNKTRTLDEFLATVLSNSLDSYLDPKTYKMPQPFIPPYNVYSTYMTKYEPGSIALPQNITELDELNSIIPPLLPSPPVINNNYAKETSPNIMSFQTPYKTYEDLPEYLKVFITREKFNAGMTTEGSIDKLISRKNDKLYSAQNLSSNILQKNMQPDYRNGLLSDKIPTVPRDIIPIIREDKFLSSFPTARPNSTPSSFPNQSVQFMIGTGTTLLKGKLKKNDPQYTKQETPSNVEMIGTETTLLKKKKEVVKY